MIKSFYKIINGRINISRKLNNVAWEEYINKFDSYKGTITVKDFCIENNITKSQFYYHKKRLANGNYTPMIFQAVSLNTKENNVEENITASKEVKINIGNANISIPVIEATLIASIIKELVAKC
ncbi:hypothetical protein [uncultured Clostridium sp.]|uniref:IS66 family insertion sequence element accessory protein TnpA n=1 Tax=uncultured Clostridium sp. TaxID=59620 RepID=UPI002588033F|nr:hypothetical protein [uncultured Clostridium sp.]